MDNHIHLIVVPKDKEGLSLGIGEVHKRYTRMINFRNNWRGYLWQGRFKSYPMNEIYLYSAIRYIERNPVRAGIVEKAEDYKWSSAKAHVYNKRELLLDECFLESSIGNWSEYLREESSNNEERLFSGYVKSTKPLGDESFIRKIEQIIGRSLKST